MVQRRGDGCFIGLVFDVRITLNQNKYKSLITMQKQYNSSVFTKNQLIRSHRKHTIVLSSLNAVLMVIVFAAMLKMI